MLRPLDASPTRDLLARGIAVRLTLCPGAANALTMLAGNPSRGIGEWGYSALIEVDGRKLLLETGARPETVLRNAAELGIDLADVTDVVLTHGHDDHTGGLLALRRAMSKRRPAALSRIHVAPSIFWARITNGTAEPSSMQAMRAVLEAGGATFVEHAGPTKIAPGVWFTGPVPRPYPERNTSGARQIRTPSGDVEDNVPEDAAVVIDTPEGLELVSGCGHAGIINMVEYAQKVVRRAPIAAAIGGFHRLRALVGPVPCRSKGPPATDCPDGSGLRRRRAALLGRDHQYLVAREAFARGTRARRNRVAGQCRVRSGHTHQRSASPMTRPAVALPLGLALMLGGCADRAPRTSGTATPIAATPATPAQPPSPLEAGAAGDQPLPEGETLGLLPFAFDSVTPLPEGSSRLTSCRRSGRWQIASRGFDDQVGTDLFIRPATNGSCATDSLPGDLVIRNQEAEYFEATWEDRLFVDSGTGPDGRGLILYELPSGRRLVALTIAEGVFRSTVPHEIQVWTQHDLRATAPGCAVRESMIPVIDSLVRVDLRTGAVTKTGTTRCAAWS